METKNLDFDERSTVRNVGWGFECPDLQNLAERKAIRTVPSLIPVLLLISFLKGQDQLFFRCEAEAGNLSPQDITGFDGAMRWNNF